MSTVGNLNININVNMTGLTQAQNAIRNFTTANRGVVDLSINQASLTQALSQSANAIRNFNSSNQSNISIGANTTGVVQAQQVVEGLGGSLQSIAAVGLGVGATQARTMQNLNRSVSDLRSGVASINQISIGANTGTTGMAALGGLARQTAVITPTVNQAPLVSGLNTSSSLLTDFRNRMTSMLSTAFGLVLAGGIIGMVKGIVNGFTDLISKGVKYNATMEQLIVSFEVLTGSTEKAVSLMKQMEDFAVATPFETKDIAQAGDILLGYGIQSEKVMGIISMLGDTSKGNTDKFRAMSLAFGQSFAAGKLNGQDLLQMISAGFNPLQELSTITGKSMTQLRKDMENGEIGIDLVMKAFMMATAEGGRFFGMMDKQSKTFIGLLSTIKDKIAIALGKATEGLTEKLKSGMGTVNLLDGLMTPESIEKFTAMIDENILPALDNLGKTLMWIFGFRDKFGDMQVDALTKDVGGLIDNLSFVALVIRNCVLLLKILWNGFRIGLDVMGAGLLGIGALMTAVVLGIANEVNIIVLGIAGVIEGIGRAFDDIMSLLGNGFVNLGKGIVNTLSYAAKSALNAIKSNLLNPFIDAYNNSIGLLSDSIKLERVQLSVIGEDPYKYNSIKDNLKGITDAFGKDNASFKLMEEFQATAAETLKSTGSIWATAMEGITKDLGGQFEAGSDALNELVKSPNLAEVDRFLDNVNKIPQKKITPPDKSNLLDGLKPADAAKGLKSVSDGVKSITESLEKATESIFKFGDAFEKVTYERFSPAKLLRRTTKIFDVMKTWVANMIQLSKLGVSEDVLNEFRGMGLKSAGMVQGLLRADAGTRSTILANIGSTNSLAQLQGGMAVKHEHGGTITVKGDNGQLQNIDVAGIISREIAANKNRYSPTPSTNNTFK